MTSNPQPVAIQKLDMRYDLTRKHSFKRYAKKIIASPTKERSMIQEELNKFPEENQSVSVIFDNGDTVSYIIKRKVENWDVTYQQKNRTLLTFVIENTHSGEDIEYPERIDIGTEDLR